MNCIGQSARTNNITVEGHFMFFEMCVFSPLGLVLDSGINGKILSHANFFLPYLISHPKPLFYEATTKL